MALGLTQPLIGVPGIFLGGKDGRCVRLTTLPPACADCLEIWEPQPPGTLGACNGIALPLPTIPRGSSHLKTLKWTTIGGLGNGSKEKVNAGVKPMRQGRSCHTVTVSKAY